MAHAQYQGSLTDQLQYMVGVANFHGMYDAADFLTLVVSQTDERLARCRECKGKLVIAEEDGFRRAEPLVPHHNQSEALC